MDSGRSETGVSTLRDLIIFAQHPLQFGQLRLPPSEFDRRGRRIESNNGTETFDAGQGLFDMHPAVVAHHSFDTILFFHGCLFFGYKFCIYFMDGFRAESFCTQLQAIGHNAHTTQGHGGPDEQTGGKNGRIAISLPCQKELTPGQ